MRAAEEQAAVEYAGTTLRDMINWTIYSVQEHWYYLAAAALLLVALWRYLRK